MNKQLALLGLPGCGKTYWGRKLAKELTINFYDLDNLVVKQSGLSIPHIFDEGGESLFRSIESSTLYDLLVNDSKEDYVLALGGGTPAFNNNMQLINEHCTSIYLNIGIDKLLDNLQQDVTNHRPLVKKTDTVELKQYIKKLQADRELAYHQADYMIYDEELNIENLKKIIQDTI